MPATYQKKYYYQFTSLDGKVNVVELWWLTATTPTAEEVKCMSMPFSVEMPDLDHKFQVVRGTGCEINLLSDTDGKFFDGLYHTNMKEYMIKHYIDGSINWLGFLNSELVSESYSESVNYPFQITGNDGFALLDRLQFLTELGAKYTGIYSQFDLIQIALNRIGLPFTNLFISFSTTFTGQSADAESTILHESYIDAANFYNEDGVAETMRKVIEGCLAPYGAIISQLNGDIYITDINLLATADPIVWKKFTQNTGAYVEAVQIDPVLDISDIGYMGTGSGKEQSGGKNKQVISYSPYPYKVVLPEGLKELSEFSGSIPASFSLRDDSHYKYKSLTGHSAFTLYSPASFEQSYRALGITVDPESEADASVCITWHAGTDNQKIFELAANPFVAISQGKKSTDIIGTRQGLFKGVGLKISGEAEFFRYWHSGSGDHDGGVRSCTIKIIVRIGDKSGTFGYRGLSSWRGNPGSTDNWLDYPGSPQVYEYITLKKDDNSNIAGNWVPFEGNLINSIDLSGQLYFDIYSNLDYIDDNGKEWVNTNVHHAQIRIRNLSISLINNETGKEVGDVDIEYIGYLDQTVKEEAEKIELICGTDATYIDRGKIMSKSGDSYSSIREWTRSGQTFKIEELLLNSLSSNYRMGYLMLNNLKLKNGFNKLNIITDSGIISGKNFMVKYMKQNFRDNLIECTLTEISPDSLTIVPQNV